MACMEEREPQARIKVRVGIRRNKNVSGTAGLSPSEEYPGEIRRELGPREAVSVLGDPQDGRLREKHEGVDEEVEGVGVKT